MKYMKNSVWTVTLFFSLCSISLFSQQKFMLTEVNRVETSYNTVTSTIYEVGNKQYAYTAGDNSKIDVFEVADEGDLKYKTSYKTAGNKNQVRGLVADNIDGKDYLFAGLKGAHSVEVFEIKPNGNLKSLHVTADTDSTYLGIIITLQVIHMKEASYLFVGGLENTPGLTSFKITNEGSLEHVQSVADTKSIFTDGIIGMSVHRTKGETYLFTGGFQDNGLSNFKVYEDGRFENVSNIGDDDTRFLNGAYPVISASLSGRNYVVVGHRHHIYYGPTRWIKDLDEYYYHGDAVSVFRVNEQGEIIPQSVFIDNSETLIRGQTRLHGLSLSDNQELVAVATRDDKSIQLFILSDTGLLIEAGKLDTGFPIYYGLTGKKIGDQIFLFAGSVKGKELVSYRLDIK
ncbi:MAG: stress protein [Cyclobacteriaceae bacterium]